jgi:ABC-2 type transport system permease protein
MEAFVFKNAFLEYMRARRVVVWLLVAGGLYAAASLFLKVNGGESREEAYSMLSSLLLFRMLPLASAIFSSGVLSQEIEQKTIVYLLTRPVPRPKFLLLRTLASALAVMIVASISAVALSAAVYGGLGLSNPYLVRDLIAIAVGSLAYGSLFVLVSLIINRSMIVCLLFAFAWETSVPSMPGSVYLLSVSSYLTAIAQRPSPGNTGQSSPFGSLASALGTNTLTADVGWMAMACLIAFCMIFGAWWFSQSEYLPREDAE